jgi:hypothetical protein
LAYFVVNDLALGATITATQFDALGSTHASYGAGPEIGYVLQLADWAAVHPVASLVYSTARLSGPPPFVDPNTGKLSPQPERRHVGFTATLEIPILLKVARNLVVGVGPTLRQDLTYTRDDVYQTRDPRIGGTITFGGWWFLGEPIPSESSGAVGWPI